MNCPCSWLFLKRSSNFIIFSYLLSLPPPPPPHLFPLPFLTSPPFPLSLNFYFYGSSLLLPFSSSPHHHPSHIFTLFLLPSPSSIALTSLLPFFRLLHFLLLPFAPGVAHGEEEQPALFCSSGLSSSCRTQMVIMELHINWLCWKLTVAVKGSRQPVPVCPCARWCIGSSWWTRCLHSAPLLLRSAQKWYGGSLISVSLYFQPVPSCLLTFWGSKIWVFECGLDDCDVSVVDVFYFTSKFFFLSITCNSWFIIFSLKETLLFLVFWLTVCVCAGFTWVLSRMETSAR